MTTQKSAQKTEKARTFRSFFCANLDVSIYTGSAEL